MLTRGEACCGWRASDVTELLDNKYDNYNYLPDQTLTLSHKVTGRGIRDTAVIVSKKIKYL